MRVSAALICPWGSSRSWGWRGGLRVEFGDKAHIVCFRLSAPRSRSPRTFHNCLSQLASSESQPPFNIVLGSESQPECRSRQNQAASSFSSAFVWFRVGCGRVASRVQSKCRHGQHSLSQDFGARTRDLETQRLSNHQQFGISLRTTNC